MKRIYLLLNIGHFSTTKRVVFQLVIWPGGSLNTRTGYDVLASKSGNILSCVNIM